MHIQNRSAHKIFSNLLEIIEALPKQLVKLFRTSFYQPINKTQSNAIDDQEIMVLQITIRNFKMKNKHNLNVQQQYNTF